MSFETRIDPHAQVSPEAQIGRGCDVGFGAVVPTGSVLGDEVKLGAGVVLVAHGSDGVLAAPHLKARCTIGPGAVIWPGITIGSGALVRPGSVVTRSVPSRAIVEGHPAAIVGYVDASSGQPLGPGAAAAPLRAEVGVEPTPVAGVTLHRMPTVADLRGNLSVGEFGTHVPFHVRRYFMVFDVPSRETRGEHAHRECHQFLICVRGSCAVVADDGLRRAEFRLESLDTGLYLPPMTWGIQYRYSADAVLLVFASHHYDPADYIRDYDEFLSLKGPR